MRVRGRGIDIDGERMPWYYDLEESAGELKGQLKVEGWDPSAAMNSWQEDRDHDSGAWKGYPESHGDIHS